MKTRTWKYIGLIVSGGLMLQLSGCISMLAELAVQQLPTLILTLLSSALGTGATTT